MLPMDSNQYGKSFYEGHEAGSRTGAEVILGHVLRIFPGIRSCVDVGCGTGLWLAVLREKGVERIQGYDGPWVLDTGALAIPSECFSPVDLNKPLDGGTKFDLAMSLEVAEHLAPANSEAFVDTLTKMADIILFSAAVPGQGGAEHINERWPT
jgi:2-polyprenyl-3-methyl-5-hydroxy-6-metoxy-1,4-benzoquinol methylase